MPRPFRHDPLTLPRGDPNRSEPQAVLLVRDLISRFGPLAFRVAQRRGRVAARHGEIGKADLYQAACVILLHGEQAYQSLRRAPALKPLEPDIQIAQ